MATAAEWLAFFGTAVLAGLGLASLRRNSPETGANEPERILPTPPLPPTPGFPDQSGEFDQSPPDNIDQAIDPEPERLIPPDIEPASTGGPAPDVDVPNVLMSEGNDGNSVEGLSPQIPDELLDGFAHKDRQTIRDAWAIAHDPALVDLLERVRESGKAEEIKINGMTIVLEPALPQRGFSLFSEGGFLIRQPTIDGDFADFATTIVHELFRLRNSQSLELGVSSQLADQESADTRRFSQQVERQVYRPIFEQGVE